MMGCNQKLWGGGWEPPWAGMGRVRRSALGLVDPQIFLAESCVAPNAVPEVASRAAGGRRPIELRSETFRNQTLLVNSAQSSKPLGV